MAESSRKALARFLSLLCLDRAVSHASLSDTSPALYSEVALASLIGAATTAHRLSLHALAVSSSPGWGRSLGPSQGKDMNALDPDSTGCG